MLSSLNAMAQQPLFKTNDHYPLISDVLYSESADINGNGKDELLMATSSTQGLRIFSVDDQGQLTAFQFKPDVPAFFSLLGTGGVIRPFTVFDVDNDLDLDVWVSNANVSLEPLLLINDGSGQFTSRTDFYDLSTPFDLVDLIPGDVDNDGDIDLVRGFDLYEAPPAYYTYLNDGSGNFTRQEILNPFYSKYHDSHLADFNQDGYLDLWRARDNLYIYLNDQSGQFNREPIEFNVDFLADNSAEIPHSTVLFADINQDGLTDVQAFSNVYNLPRLINNGDGTFSQQARSDHDLEPSKQTAELIDVNDDGILDLWVTTENQGAYTVLTDQQGFVDNSSRQFFANDEVKHLDLLDFNQDGLNDVVNIGLSQLNVFQQTNQSFEKIRQTVAVDQWGKTREVRLGDLNGDGFKDLIQVNGGVVKYRLGNGRTAFGALASTGVKSTYRLDVADMNGDGMLDLVTAVDNTVLISLAKTGGGFTTRELSPTDERVLKTSIADMDGDGDIDMVVQLSDYFSGSGQSHVYFNDGEANFSLFQVLMHRTYKLELADLDQDGLPSVILISIGSAQPEELFEYEFSGTDMALIKSAEIDGLTFSVFSIFAYDADADGDLDVLLSVSAQQEQTTLFSNEGDSFLERNDFLNMGSDYILERQADLNNDGYQDFIASDPPALLLNNQAGGFDEAGFAADSYFRFDSPNLLEDLDEDGDLDFITANAAVGQTINLNTTVDQDFNGLWYNASQNGHGLQVQEISNNNEQRLLVSWYVFADGQPVWLNGTGPVVGNQASLDVTITAGPQFGAAYDTEDLMISEWGSMKLTLAGANELLFEWDGSLAGFSQGQLEMERLAEIKAVNPLTDGLDSCHTGAWYNAAEDGHGFMLQVIENQGEERLQLSWYTYQNGQQFWLNAVGPINGKQASLEAFSASGGDFPPNFDPDQVTLTPWGQIDFELTDNNNAQVSWQPTQAGFTAGELAVTRLTVIDRYRCQ